MTKARLAAASPRSRSRSERSTSRLRCAGRNAARRRRTCARPVSPLVASASRFFSSSRHFFSSSKRSPRSSQFFARGGGAEGPGCCCRPRRRGNSAPSALQRRIGLCRSAACRAQQPAGYRAARRPAAGADRPAGSPPSSRHGAPTADGRRHRPRRYRFSSSLDEMALAVGVAVLLGSTGARRLAPARSSRRRIQSSGCCPATPPTPRPCSARRV